MSTVNIGNDTINDPLPSDWPEAIRVITGKGFISSPPFEVVPAADKVITGNPVSIFIPALILNVNIGRGPPALNSSPITHVADKVSIGIDATKEKGKMIVADKVSIGIEVATNANKGVADGVSSPATIDIEEGVIIVCVSIFTVVDHIFIVIACSEDRKEFPKSIDGS
jgi:hypothetical protein